MSSFPKLWDIYEKFMRHIWDTLWICPHNKSSASFCTINHTKLVSLIWNIGDSWKLHDNEYVLTTNHQQFCVRLTTPDYSSPTQSSSLAYSFVSTWFFQVLLHSGLTDVYVLFYFNIIHLRIYARFYRSSHWTW